MTFKRESKRDLYLENTPVENIFLAEYMPDADATAIKVYLTALMYAGNEDMNNTMIARHLGVAEEDVLQAWNFWEQCGVIRKHYLSLDDRFHYNVEFLNLKERIYSPLSGANASASAGDRRPEMDDEVLRETFAQVQEITGRLLESREPEQIMSWIYDDRLEPEYIVFVYRFCTEKRQNTHYKYIASVLSEWLTEGITSIAAATGMLEETDQRYSRRQRVMKALGFRRNATEAEAVKIDGWFDEMGFDMTRVLEACAKTSGISNPNINYVNSILTAWSRDGVAGGAAPVTERGRKNAVQLVKQSYDESRKRHREELEAHLQEIRTRIPRMAELENELHRATVQVTKLALGRGGRGGQEDAALLRQRIQRLNDEKTQLLQRAGYPEDYMELQYDCALCKDTGVLENGDRCQCFAEKLNGFLQQG